VVSLQVSIFWDVTVQCFTDGMNTLKELLSTSSGKIRQQVPPDNCNLSNKL
jgi:hypothetical protein